MSTRSGSLLILALTALVTSSAGVAVAQGPSGGPGSSGAFFSPTMQPAPTPEPIRANGVTFLDSQHGLLVGSTADLQAAMVWSTFDGGVTWASTRLDAAPLESVAKAGSGSLMASGMCGSGAADGCHSTVVVSDDAGTTWRTGGDASLTSLTLADPERGWAISVPFGDAGVGVQTGELVSTSDGGQTWVASAVDPCPRLMDPVAVSFVSAASGWVACDGEGAGFQGPKAISATLDAGGTWSVQAKITVHEGAVGSITMSDQLAGVAMAPDGSGLAWGGHGTVLRTTDGGRVWDDVGGFAVDCQIPSAVALLDEAWYLLTWDCTIGQQQLLISEDRGVTWTGLTTIPAPPAIDPTSSPVPTPEVSGLP